MARLRGWRPKRSFTLAQWGWPINIAALVYGVGAVINMLWPRSPADPWYSNYAMLFTTGIVLVTGLLYMSIAKPHHNAKIKGFG